MTGFIYAGKSFLHKPIKKHLIAMSFTENTLPIYFKGVIWYDFKFYFLFGVLQAGCA